MIDNDFKALVPQALSNIRELAWWLDVSLEQMNDGNTYAAHDNDLSAEDCLKHARRTALQVGDHVVELLDLVERLLAQRKSTHDAFEAGWNGRYQDLLAKLSSDEYGELRQALSEDEEQNDSPEF